MTANSRASPLYFRSMNLRSIMSTGRIFLIGAVVLLGIYGFSQRSAAPEDGETKIGLNVGDRAPELAFLNADSTKVLKLSELKGKYVLILRARAVSGEWPVGVTIALGFFGLAYLPAGPRDGLSKFRRARGMVKPIDTNAPPPVTVTEIGDPTVTNAGIELLDQDVVQLQATPLHVRRVVVRLAAAVVVYYSTNLRVRTRTSVREGLLGYVAFGPRASGKVNGLPVRPGLMLAAAPALEATFVADPGWESITFLLPARDIEEWWGGWYLVIRHSA